MAANLIIQDSGGTAAVTSADFTGAELGTTTVAQQFRVFNDNGGGSVDTAVAPVVVVRQYNEDEEAVLSGLPGVDERYIEVRALDTGTTDQQETEWQALGRGRVLSLAPIEAGEYAVIEVRYSPPFSGPSGELRFLLGAEANYDRVSLDQGHTESQRDGVCNGIGDSAFSELQRGGAVTESGSPDEFVNVERTVWVHNGARYGYEGTVELTATDGDSATLGASEYYVALLSLGADNSITVTKSSKASLPADLANTPTVPDGELALCAVVRDDAATIEDSDITRLLNTGGFALSVSTLTATVGPGQAVVDNGLVIRTAQTAVGLTDDAENYLWLHPDGSITATTAAVEPVQRANLLWHLTAAAGAVTQQRDRRGWVGGERVVVAFSFPDATDLQTAYWQNPHPRPAWLRLEESALVRAFGAPSGNATGELAFDVEVQEPGGSWTAVYASADRPGITVNVDEDAESFPVDFLIPSGADIRVTTDLVSSYDGTAPTDIYLTLALEAA